MTLDPLEQARAIVRAGDLLGFASWRRAAGILTRQALEAALAELWTNAGHPEMNDVPVTKQLLALPYWRPGWERLGRDVRAAYDGLSATCHASLYEVPAPPTQLLDWCDAVDRLRAKVAATPPGSRTVVQRRQAHVSVASDARRSAD